MSEPLVARHDERGRLRLTLNRPDQANAVDDGLCNALLVHLQTAAADGTRVVVLDGNGKNFCGGFDLSNLDALSEGDLLLRFVRIEQALQLLWRGPFLSVACVHGAVYGAGADIVAACSFRIGEPRCRFRFPGYRFGVALGTRRLGCLVGEQKARSILLENAVVDDVEAKAVGLLTHVEDRSDWPHALSVLTDIAEGLPAPALADLLGNIRQGDGSDALDMSRLVASVARPGLRERITAYRAAMSRDKSV